MFASRTDWSFSPNPLAARLEAMKRAGEAILDLTESNPTKCGFSYPEAEILAPLADSANLRYEPSPQGLREAREAIAHYYAGNGVSLNPEHIFLTAGTSEAYSFLFRLFLNPGEGILLPRPSYPLFDFLARLNDLEFDHYPLIYDESWRIDLERLKGSLTLGNPSQTPRVLLLVNPNNPTGSFLKSHEHRELMNIARENDLILISDEVFSDYAWEADSRRISCLAATDDVLVASLGGISKALALPQMKLGWIALNGPPDRLEAAGERLEVILDTYLSVNTPVQNALARWFSLRHEIQNQIKEQLRENRNFLQILTAKYPAAQYLSSEGGWYAIVRLPRTRSEEEWALEFLAQDKVYVHPGYFFDFEEEAYIVVSLLSRPELFREGMSRILARV